MADILELPTREERLAYLNEQVPEHFRDFVKTLVQCVYDKRNSKASRRR